MKCALDIANGDFLRKIRKKLNMPNKFGSNIETDNNGNNLLLLILLKERFYFFIVILLLHNIKDFL